MSDFIFVTCQIGAEGAVKGELARRWPAFRLAFSRPGFLTFKLPSIHRLAEDFDLESVFARAYGFSLGKVTGKTPEKIAADLRAGAGRFSGQYFGQTPEELAAGVWKAAEGRPVQRIHVWQKDARAAGDRGFEPSLSEEASNVHRLLVEACPHPENLVRGGVARASCPCSGQHWRDASATQAARAGESVLDCVLLTPDQWWIGYHRANSIPSLYPGGMMSLELPLEAVSRAWLKMEEALRWSRLPIPRGARVAEIGSAPGGASQALLARGMWVTGIDPAEMDPAVLNHPCFTHIRRRSTQVRRREFQKIRWLTADMNVAPKYTLDAIEAIVAHPRVSIRGLLLTLKLTRWDLAEQLPDHLDRIRSWGFNVVRARQLHHNGREVCVAALQQPFHRKPFLGQRR
ncbi:MAG: hypothetical protein KKE86_05880 [Planctomycetes bacterium]|nr:hypothetical protein [Planctomycetota bacterium]MBU4398851.1 hypothetical protein [Planctomycetota bacterium]MCG2682455.1 hypothetical protein [Planctomycetales bacterium]